MRRALAALFLLGCSGSIDVVARSEVPATPSGANGGEPGKPNEPPTATGTPPEACPVPPSGGAMLTKREGIVRFDATVKGVVDTQALGCAPGPIAVDRAGTLFVAGDGQLSVAADGVCKPLGIAMSPTAMAFVWSPSKQVERLYVLEKGVLLSVDVAGAAPLAKVGPMSLSDVRSLGATSDGALYAFAADANDVAIEIGLVSLSDATILASWGTKNPDGARFGGGVPTQAGFALVFGARSFTFQPATGALSLHAPLFGSDPGIVSLATSPCAILNAK